MRLPTFVAECTDSQPEIAGFESQPGRKFSNQTCPFLDKHGCKRMCLEVMRKRYRVTIFKKSTSKKRYAMSHEEPPSSFLYEV
jgi:hypothetical protein